MSADPEHRDRVLAGVGRAGRDFVWRDHDEEKLFPKDYERALVLAAKRGLRSFILAFSVRAGVNVILLLFRTLRKKKLRFLLLLRAIFGAESFRFGGMIGRSSHAVPTDSRHIYLPEHLDSASIATGSPLVVFQETVQVWNMESAVVRAANTGRRRRGKKVASGSCGCSGQSRAIVGDRRKTDWCGSTVSLHCLYQFQLTIRMFVRGLQASYNQYTPRYGIHIPHGDLLLFGACCGQIMFAWLVSPETIPHAYNRW